MKCRAFGPKPSTQSYFLLCRLSQPSNLCATLSSSRGGGRSDYKECSRCVLPSLSLLSYTFIIHEILNKVKYLKIFFEKFFLTSRILLRKIAATESRLAPCYNAADFIESSAARGGPKISGCNFVDPACGLSYVKNFRSLFSARQRSSSLRSLPQLSSLSNPAYPGMQLIRKIKMPTI